MRTAPGDDRATRIDAYVALADSTIGANRRRLRNWSDALVASDPGLRRLIQALQVAAGIGITIAAEYGLAQLAHPFWESVPAGVHLSPAAAAGLAEQHHALTLIAMLLGGIVALISTIAVTDVIPREEAVTMAGMPIPFLAAVAISIELAPHRTIALVGLALIMGLGTYVRKFAPRFGPRVVMYGILLFIGYFFGFIAGKELPIGQVYWIAAILWLAVAVNLALRLIVFDRLAAGILSRSRRAFTARARGVLVDAAALLQDAETSSGTPTRRARRLARRLVRLNEAAITIDGQLADPRFKMGNGLAQRLHDSLFELELQLENLARAVGVLADPGSELDARMRARVASWLTSLAGAGDSSGAAAYERENASEEPVGTPPRTSTVVFATAMAVVEVGESLERWQRAEPASLDAGDQIDLGTAYETPVMLMGGSLVGSTMASNATIASDTSSGLAARLHLDAAAISAIRMTVAVGAACAIGSAVNETRFYWAVLAIFMIYMGANTAGEQISRAVERVLGTCAGIVLGSLLAHAIGPSTWTIAVMLAALAFGVYFSPVSSGLMALGITVTLSVLYADLGEFSNGLLLDRLELTAIGAAIAILAALLIFPVRTGRVLRQAALGYLDALLALVEGLAGTPGTTPDGQAPASASAPTIAARHVDDTLQQLLVTARPLTRDPFHRDALENNLGTFVASAHFARNLAAGAGSVAALADRQRLQLAAALETEANLVRDLHEIILSHQSGLSVQPVSSAVDALVTVGRDLAAQGIPRADPQQRFLRALSNLDGTLIQLSRQLTDA